MSSATRRFSLLDRLVIEADRALSTVFGLPGALHRPIPAADIVDGDMDAAERRHAAGLMRINHTGEICAQGLYFGQAAVARDPATRDTLLHAGFEEGDHLLWCEQRLHELGHRPSLTNAFWYAGSYTIGVAAGLFGDGYNLGFVVETERQVEGHLTEHLDTLPPGDQRSRAIVSQMREEEIEHGNNAKAAGARQLPPPIPSLMALTSKLMKVVTYRV
ncbi:MAG: 2-polyprenyl-3-methyl-6-methoxy-1,4-benzoquinone monooxygenase [Lysobacteraceae bacterium]